MFFAERDPIFQGMGNHMTLGIEAQVVDPLTFAVIRRRYREELRGEQRFAKGRSPRGGPAKDRTIVPRGGVRKLPLAGVEFARLVQFPPFGKGKHPVTVVVLQPVRIETLIIPDVFPLSLRRVLTKSYFSSKRSA